ncbi:MAG: sugar phosphate isomerase/epimerase [Lachnospiraceae bacterium]|nr:sugar phosphate isomerase/epimerase [Lachnospiraceae bacterium]
MIQVQPRFVEKEKWFDYAVKRTLRFEILEFSSVYLNQFVGDEQYNWYRNTGLVDSIHGVFMDNYPVSPDNDIRNISRKRCRKSCRQAQMVGARNVVFHSTALPFVRGGLEELWGRDAAEYYEGLAEEFDLNIYIENFSDVDFVPLQRMMSNVSGDRVKVCLDIGHANYTRYTVAQWFEASGDSVGYIHISDNKGLWDDHMILGQGNVEFNTADEYYRSKGGEIPLTIEVHTLEELDASISYLEEQHLFGF